MFFCLSTEDIAGCCLKSKQILSYKLSNTYKHYVECYRASGLASHLNLHKTNDKQLTQKNTDKMVLDSFFFTVTKCSFHFTKRTRNPNLFDWKYFV